MAVQCVATHTHTHTIHGWSGAIRAKNENVMFKCPMMYCFHFLYLLLCMLSAAAARPFQFFVLLCAVAVAAAAAAIDAIAHVVANENI